MKKAQFLTPVVTAFDAEGNLDHQANKSIYDFLINGGIDGLVIMGSTGEFFSMQYNQRVELIDLVVNHVRHQTKVYIGTTCMCLEETIALSNYAIDAGADGVMIISPYYFALSDESIEYYYDQVANAVKGDIYLYNFPVRTGHDLSPEVTLSLLRKHENIKGYKDTVTEMAHTRKLIQTVRNEFPDFIIYSGFDENFAHNILSGGNGCIGGLSNVYPEIFSKWVKAVDANNFEKIAFIQKIVNKMMELYDIGNPFIPITKKAMMIRGISLQEFCQKPLISPNQKQTEVIESLIKEIDGLITIE
ncbi:dihydrodipicolinate synthase family protein [Bacillus sp. Au-Bac7]|uniref:dihydrodipicolinate synthase family protein n=1 Tax=Bacillus sp. Au-Bac7 TaxID=2906458 RepID=UPI00177EA17B|nr:dihydrodipicolinate synthase family protein [Bacillus sp. Au-Bac7]MBE0313565.1 dihydrodipicolinate synthase family protein [Xanthomonas citri pv. punicae]MCE4049899.1 dihydrodipicolinate synthase family protein [Bacillus sp. Au-Bac7]